MTYVDLLFGDFIMKVTPMEQNVAWLPTKKAVNVLGVCRRTLHRWIEAGHLLIGEHYLKGLTPRSPHRWNVRAIEARIIQLRTTMLQHK